MSPLETQYLKLFNYVLKKELSFYASRKIVKTGPVSGARIPYLQAQQKMLQDLLVLSELSDKKTWKETRDSIYKKLKKENSDFLSEMPQDYRDIVVKVLQIGFDHMKKFTTKSWIKCLQEELQVISLVITKNKEIWERQAGAILLEQGRALKYFKGCRV